MKIIDLTHTIADDILVYPETEPVRLTPANTLEQDNFRETLLHMSSHTGTHMDAPAHMLAKAPYLDDIPVESFCGKAYVLDCAEPGTGNEIKADLLRKKSELRDVDYLVLSTGWEKYWGMKEYFGDFPVLSEDAVDYLLKLGLKGIGTDTMSVDRMNSTDFPIHHRFMANHLVIIENLCNLAPIREKSVLFAALPLKFRRSDGAPVRAIAAVS